MDVHCTTCGEPWDVHHLWHDAIFETELSEPEAKTWLSLPSALRLSDRYRQEFIAAGWHFGRTVINVIRCPACPDVAQTDPDLVRIKAEIEDLMGDDEDGLAATYSDYRL